MRGLGLTPWREVISPSLSCLKPEASREDAGLGDVSAGYGCFPFSLHFRLLEKCLAEQSAGISSFSTFFYTQSCFTKVFMRGRVGTQWVSQG